MKTLNILSFILVVFIFSSCQKCTECTNENLLGGGNGDGIDFEIEVCEDDFENGGLYLENIGDPFWRPVFLLKGRIRFLSRGSRLQLLH